MENRDSKIRRICVFCGSSIGGRREYHAAAHALGALLGRSGIGLVYGGGRTGMMGAVADAALAAGTEVTGVIPESLATKELKHSGLTSLYVVRSMHERKAKMAELADAFVALPGGLGTFEELCEILTWAQLGLHKKPCGILNVAGYFNPLLALFDHAVEERFLHSADRGLLLDSDDPEILLQRLKDFEPVDRKKWIGPVES